MNILLDVTMNAVSISAASLSANSRMANSVHTIELKSRSVLTMRGSITLFWSLLFCAVIICTPLDSINCNFAWNLFSRYGRHTERNAATIQLLIPVNKQLTPKRSTAPARAIPIYCERCSVCFACWMYVFVCRLRTNWRWCAVYGSHTQSVCTRRQ